MDTSFDAGGNVSIGLTATTIVSQWTWAATLLQSSNVGTKVSEGMQSLHSNVHSIKFYVWYNRSSNISRRNISCFLKLYISPGERTNHGPPVHGQPKWITQIDYPWKSFALSRRVDNDDDDFVPTTYRPYRLRTDFVTDLITDRVPTTLPTTYRSYRSRTDFVTDLITDHLPTTLPTTYILTSLSSKDLVTITYTNHVADPILTSSNFSLYVLVWHQWSVLVRVRRHGPDPALCNNVYSAQDQLSRSQNLPPGRACSFWPQHPPRALRLRPAVQYGRYGHADARRNCSDGEFGSRTPDRNSIRHHCGCHRRLHVHRRPWCDFLCVLFQYRIDFRHHALVRRQSVHRSFSRR